MSEILFISHRIPFPPDRGDKIRSHNVLKRIARLAPVHVATFADDDRDMAEEVELAALARSYKLVFRTKPLTMAGLQALATGRPVSLTAFHDSGLAAYVSQVLTARPISAIYVFSGQMGQYVPATFKGRIVADFVDVDSAKFDAYAAKRRSPMRWIEAREARILRAEEARLAARADVSLLISASEAELFRSRLDPALRETCDIRVLGNGIDTQMFDPLEVESADELAGFSYPRLIFTGQMDYSPNVDAVIRAARHIMPLIRESFPDASFHIVGRNPAPQVMELHGKAGCQVWGRVDDMRAWLKGADLALVPLDIARGVQNKVLEAMAMTLPVVLTPGAATGIGANDRQHFAVAESDTELAAAAVAYLRDPRLCKINGVAARRFVINHASWQAALEPLPEILGWTGRGIRNAA